MRKNILRILHKTLYVLFFLIGALLSFYKMGLFANILDKSQFGLYILVMSSYVYFIYLFSLGANEYLLKKGSIEKCSRKKRALRNVALVHGSMSLALSILFFKPFSFFLGEMGGQVYNIAALLSLSALIFSILETYFRVEEELLKFSGMMAFKSISCVFFIFLFDEVSGFEEAVYIEVLSNVFVAILVVSFLLISGHNFFQVVRISLFIDILKNGFSFCISIMLRNGLVVLDKIFISSFVGAVFLGYYGFVFITYQAGILASSIVMSVLGPKILFMSKDLGKTEQINRVVFFITVFVSISAGVLYPFVERIYVFGVSSMFEQYDNDLTYQLFLSIYFSTIVTVLSSVWDWLFISSSKENVLLKFSLWAFLFFLIGLFLIHLKGLDGIYVGWLFLSCKLFILFFQVLYQCFLMPKEVKAK